MSLKPVPVCRSCNRCTEKSISCTNCYQMCCIICLNLPTDLTVTVTKDDSGRLCPKCTDSISIKQEPMDQPCTSTMERDRDLCDLHDKPHLLFCLNCSVCICGDCVGEKQHEMHHVNNLVVVYRENLADMERKLADAEKKLASSSVYETNLEKLEKEEESIMKAVLIMKQQAISGLASMTAKRKENLKSKVKLYADKRKRLTKLRETVRKLTAKDFLTKRSTLDRECDNLMMVECTPNRELEPVDDLKCGLVPSYTFANLKCTGLTTATSKLVCVIKSACDVNWNVTVSKLLTALQVELNPTDSGIFKFIHKLVVIIPHKDPAKEIRKTFDLGDAFNTFAIVEMSYLTEHGFFNESGNISLRIGVRPRDALIEKMLLNYNCEKLKVKNSTLELQLESITKAVDYKHYTSHFKLPLDLLKTKGSHLSPGIFDHSGRHWGLDLCATMLHGCPTEVQAWMKLIKGTPTKCQFFIELKHQDAQKTIVFFTSYNFVKYRSYGWKSFISWNEIVDPGYTQDGNLLFRYGVKLLPD